MLPHLAAHLHGRPPMISHSSLIFGWNARLISMVTHCRSSVVNPEDVPLHASLTSMISAGKTLSVPKCL